MGLPRHRLGAETRPYGAQLPATSWGLFSLVAVLGCGWLGMTFWAVAVTPSLAEQVSTVVVPGWVAIALVLAAASLGGAALLSCQVSVWHGLSAMVAGAAVWAGLATRHMVSVGDGLAMVAAVAAVVASAQGPRLAVLAGLCAGTSVGCSPLAVGVAAGLLCASRASGGGRSGWGRTLGGVLIGWVAVAAVTGLAGRTPWGAVACIPWLRQFGPAAAWRWCAGTLDLVAPLLCLGALGAMHGDEEDPDRDGSPATTTAPAVSRVWFWFNLGVWLCLPRTAASHAMLMVTPGVLLAGAGWQALRRLGRETVAGAVNTDDSVRALAGSNTPRQLAEPAGKPESPEPPLFLPRLISGVSLFLLAVLLWSTLRAAGERIIIALWTPE